MKKVACMLIIIFSLFTFVGCSGKTDALQKELTELQQTVAAQAEKIAELEAAKAAQAETIAALQNAENLSAEEIAALEAQLAEQESYLATLIPKGAFCSLQTAYDNGWLTDKDLKDIAYYYKVITDPSITDSKVTSAVYNSDYVDALTLYAMKLTYIEEERQKYWPKTTRKPRDIFFGHIYGRFGPNAKCFVLKLSALRLVGQPVIEPYFRDEKIGKYTFKNYCEMCIYVWYPIEG